jgi:hypothetical protein
MPDLSIPQRQTFPAIRGSVADEEGLLPLITAESVDLILNGPNGTPIVILPCVVLDPPEDFELDGVVMSANWEAPLAGATSAVAAEISYTAKLKITWDSTPGAVLQQFAPQVGFLEIEIVENLVES